MSIHTDYFANMRVQRSSWDGDVDALAAEGATAGAAARKRWESTRKAQVPVSADLTSVEER